MRCQFAPTVRLLLDGVGYEVESADGKVVRVRSAQFGVTKELSRAELVTAWMEQRLHFQRAAVPEMHAPESAGVPVFDLTMLDEKHRHQVELRLRIVRALEHSGSRTRGNVRQILDTLAQEGLDVPSIATVYRFLHRYEMEGRDPLALLTRRTRTDERLPRYDPRLTEIIQHRIDKEYLDNARRITVREVARLVQEEVQTYNENPALLPHEHIVLPREEALYKQVQRVVGKLDKYEVAKIREGKRAADLRYGMVHKSPSVDRIMQRVEIDHTRCDLFLVDELGTPIGRPWLTIAVDRYSRYPLGSYVDFGEPSTARVLHCLRHAIMPKDHVSVEFPEVQHRWLAYGLPECVAVDNGREFHGEDFRSACAQLGIEIDYMPPGKPWFKAVVERWFGTLNRELLHQLKGTTFSNIASRRDYDPEKHAVIRASTFRRILHSFVIDTYANKLHRGLSGIPARVWQEQLSTYPPALPPSEQELVILLSMGQKRMLHQAGV